MKLDPRLRGQLPRVEPSVPFTSPNGRIKGWKVTIPGRRPLATPAVVDSRVFLGGGFGSYDFYAFDAGTGNVAWQYQTEDDGPTAAAVQDGYVAFNTESCELEVLTVTGQPVWKKWLGDPLMSMPALERGRVYMAYPDSRGDRQHYLACFDLRTGREYWKRAISGEIITAPVLADGHVYLTTLDGTLSCFQQDDGTRRWQEPKNATSSPVVWNHQCYFSQRQEVPLDVAGKQGVQQWEHVAARGAEAGAGTRPYRATARAADWLDHAKRKKGSPYYAASEAADAAVGFAAFKGDAKIDQAMKNLGQGHVHGIWAYQGSKPFLSKGRLYSALGDTLHCVNPQTDEAFWGKTLRNAEPRGELLDSVVTPPVLVNGKVFVGTIFGEVYCLSAQSGEVLWSAGVGEPIVFQPAVAQGWVYVSTNLGSLFGLETGDPRDDGWLMWGATAAHNGLPE
jgi:outer membrane protein assembly factor BamB